MPACVNTHEYVNTISISISIYIYIYIYSSSVHIQFTCDKITDTIPIEKIKRRQVLTRIELVTFCV